VQCSNDNISQNLAGCFSEFGGLHPTAVSSKDRTVSMRSIKDVDLFVLVVPGIFTGFIR
jgi:hypothetical protein